MKSIYIIMITVMIFAVAVSTALPPDWDDTELTVISDSRIQKFINNGSVFIDDNNFIHLAYLQERQSPTIPERDLYYTFRDHTNRWSAPELITIAGLRFTNLNVIVNPVTGNVEIYGNENWNLRQLVRNNAGVWTNNEIRAGINGFFTPSVTIDFEYNIHIIGTTYNHNRQSVLSYVNNTGGEWEDMQIEITTTTSDLYSLRPVIRFCERRRTVVAYVDGDRITIVQRSSPEHNQWRLDAIESPNNSDKYFDVAFIGDYIHLIVSGEDTWANRWQQYYFTRNFDAEVWRNPVLISGTRSLVKPVMAVDADNKLHIIASETTANNHTGYIYYMTNSGDDWSLVNPFEGRRFYDPLLKIDKRNNFQLVFVQLLNNSYEAAAQNTPWQPVLPVPENLTGRVVDGEPALTWDRIELPDFPPVPQFLGYHIYRQAFNDNQTERITEEAVIDNNYTDVDVTIGVYDYFVTASFQGDESDKSHKTTVQMLPKPVNLTGEVTVFDVKLRWHRLHLPDHPAMPGLFGYNVYRKRMSDVNFIRVNDANVTDTTYTDRDLAPNTYEYYVVAAYQHGFVSAASDTIVVRVRSRLPQPQFNPLPGYFTQPVNLYIGSANEEAVIYYTLDGTVPDEESLVYETPVLLDQTTTVKARSFHRDYLPSLITEGVYTIETLSTDDGLPQVTYETKLHNAYPNPFNPSTVISWSLNETAPVRIAVFDTAGRLVKVLSDGVKTPGEYHLTFESEALPSGIYYYRIETPHFTDTKKFILLR